jgi:Tol biopolymer transport system component
MPLSAGTRLGPYEILSLLGAGGMGEVYRAKDTKLHRDVAIKVLPSEVAADPDRRARFDREAQVLASLNHPNIAHIHGVDDSPGTPALIMELVEGPTLADRIAKGPIPLDEALPIAKQIAAALEAAHECGIVHRDLKPANIKVRSDGTVKVLDFGLAKAIDDAPDRDLTHSPTITVRGTRAGVLMGTAAYMSPQQARGESVDGQADIWAFGCVLFEMIAARRAFSGQTASDVVAAVLERQPDWSVLPAAIPANIRHLLARCLQKDPKRRWRDIGDVRIELEHPDAGRPAGETTAPASTRIRERIAWVAAVMLIGAAGALAALMLRKTPGAPEVRFDVSFPHDVPTDFAQIAVSPDGQQIVAALSFAGLQPLWLRPLRSTTGRTLPGTEGAIFPFWSPDGESIGFFADNKLKRITVEGLAVEILAPARVGRGGAWLADGTILFAPEPTGPLYRVPATGGEPVMVTHLQQGQNDHRAPLILPDGQHMLYYSRGSQQVRGVWVARIDGTESKRLLDADAAAVYASGHLLFVRQNELFAQPFDAARLTTSGAPFRVVDRVAVNPGVSLASLSASASGAIAYSGGTFRRTQLAWFDRSGKRLESFGPADLNSLANPALSPDGRQVAFSRVMGGNWDIWLSDLQGAMRRFTSSIQLEFSPVWSADGRQIIFQSANSNLNAQSVNDGAPDRSVLKGVPEMQYPNDVSPDGRTLLYTRSTNTLAGGSVDLWSLSLVGDPAPRPFVQTAFNERDGQFSPDGKWVAYQSDESGHSEVYLQPFPGPGERIQVSTGAGQQVRWGRGSGAELFFIGGGQQLMSAPVTFTARGATVGNAVPLFRMEFDANFLTRQQYAVSPDDQRFLVNAVTDVVDPSSMTVILNWKGRQ